ncbi:HAD family hydrolase [Viridibacillus arvi]|uniref:HAD family hydrolase n=1 Tax=Viridibacillus arvi TaxID=263475 RepID=UPI00187B886C|nr:HAD family hydrolase [Viridibacillus sp. JNUCC-6]QOV12202.1 HAD family hydrolase [Viridibacillus sp. JNUCC-6]
MNYQYILFDLDGTLTDPKVGITKSVAYALDKMNIEVVDYPKLDLFIGPPLQESFLAYYGLNERQANEAIGYYRERFKQHGLYENEVYPGIKTLLETLKKKGKTLAVATSKPTVFAEKILQHFKLAQYFDVIVGSNLDGTRIEKAEVIHEVLLQLSSPDKSEIIMIGDRKHDLIGAKQEGIANIGVLYGYGSKEELALEEPTYIVSNIEELDSILTN